MKASAVAFFLLAPILASCQTPVWGQCGGIGFNGNKQCQSGNYCRFQNDWYSQCIPGTDPNGGTPSSSSSSTTTPATTPTSTVVPTSSVPTSTGGTTQPTGGVAIPSTAAGSLNEKARVNKNRYFGTATDQNTLSVSQLQNIVKTEFGVVTPENSMKMDTMQSSRGSFNFGGADYLVNFAQQNNKLVRGHTLVWHSQLPQWVKNINNRNDLISVIETHVSTVMGRYKGKIFHWDVVNEIFEEDGSFRRSVYYNVLGEEFVAIAFRAARKADPNCILFINDYNLDYEGPKLNAMVSLVNKLRAQGVPIDGIGSQAHLIVGNGAVGATPAALAKLHSTGALVAITELDIRIQTPVTSAKLEQQARDYTTVVNACLVLARCVGISVWGVDDGHSWVPGTFPGEDDALLWNRQYQKKPAYTAVSNALN